jgi:hypothetical protein
VLGVLTLDGEEKVVWMVLKTTSLGTVSRAAQEHVGPEVFVQPAQTFHAWAGDFGVEFLKAV